MNEKRNLSIYNMLLSFNKKFKSTIQKSVRALSGFISDNFFSSYGQILFISILFILSLNLAIIIKQFETGDFAESDMWFFAYKLKYLDANGIKTIFIKWNNNLDIHPPLYYLTFLLLHKIGLSFLWISALLKILIPVISLTLIYMILSNLLGEKKYGAIGVFLYAFIPTSGSVHGLSVSLPSTLSLIPLLCGIYFLVILNNEKKDRHFLAFFFSLFVASMTHILACISAIVLIVFVLILYRDSISKKIIVTLNFIIMPIFLYTLWLFDHYTRLTLVEILRNVTNITYSPERMSYLINNFSFRNLPEIFGPIFVFSLLAGIYMVFFRKKIDKNKKFYYSMALWALTLFIISQSFFCGFFIANQRFFLFLPIPLVIFACKGFFYAFSRIKKWNNIVASIFLTLMILYSLYIPYLKSTWLSPPVNEEEEDIFTWAKDSIPKESTIFIDSSIHGFKYKFMYLTDHDKVLHDETCIEVLSKSRVRDQIYEYIHIYDVSYMIMRSDKRVEELINIIGEDTTIVKNFGKYYVLKPPNERGSYYSGKK